jgi:hypothetical protein
LLALGAGAARAESHTPSVAVVEARADGVQPAAATAVSRQVFATIARIGYRATPEALTAALVARSPAGSSGAPLAPVDLLQVATQSHADHALAATVSAHGGLYVLALVLANADRTGPFYASETADAATLEATADRMVRSILPPAPPPAPTEDATAEDATDPGERGVARLAIQTESAFGIAAHPFYNHLFGARVDYWFPGGFALGGYLGYVNLKGMNGRASNVLPYLQLEYRLHWPGGSRVLVPLRFGSGYLPKNGPFLRLAAGPSFPIGESTRLGFDLIAPTFWIVKNSTVVSLDVAAELSFEL